MPDEPAPVGGLVGRAARTKRPSNPGEDERAPQGALGALASRTLASQEAHRRELLEAIRTPIITTSLNGRITSFNAAAVARCWRNARSAVAVLWYKRVVDRVHARCYRPALQEIAESSRMASPAQVHSG